MIHLEKGDGTSIAQQAADVIVAAHMEDGVAEAIERYVLWGELWSLEAPHKVHVVEHLAK